MSWHALLRISQQSNNLVLLNNSAVADLFIRYSLGSPKNCIYVLWHSVRIYQHNIVCTINYNVWKKGLVRFSQPRCSIFRRLGMKSYRCMNWKNKKKLIKLCVRNLWLRIAIYFNSTQVLTSAREIYVVRDSFHRIIHINKSFIRVCSVFFYGLITIRSNT